jgi:phytoene dehydrogenase-like protein
VGVPLCNTIQWKEELMQKSVIIIGGGIAGLSAGCYACMNGYDATIFELHTIPGGLCTSWRRKGYTMDGCLQYLTGSGPAANAHQMWRELGALQDKQIFDRSEFIRVQGNDGRELVFYADLERFRTHLHALDAQDSRLIDNFCDGALALAKLDLPLDMPLTPQENLKFGISMLPYLRPVLKWNGVSMFAYAARFKDPFLREALPHFFQFAHPTFPMTIMLMTMGLFHKRNAGFPLGGSLKFALGIARRFEALGGNLHCRTRVTDILVESGSDGDRAVGVRLDDGSEQRADYVISACDGYDVLFTMLEGRYCTDKIRNYYQTLPIAGPIVQVSLGVARDMSAIPHSINFPMQKPRLLAGKPTNRLVAKHYAYDPSLAPAGKSAVTLWLDADYEYWKRVYAQNEAYEDAQDEVADVVIDELDARLPGFKSQVEVVDVATPPTYERFTENWRGAIAGWSITSRKMSMMMGKGMDKQLPGLRNFYMIGQWVEPAGNVELSAASGRDAIKLLCRADKQPFATTLPPAQAAAPERAAIPGTAA